MNKTLNKTLLSKLKREAHRILVGREVITFEAEEYTCYVDKANALDVDAFIVDSNSKFGRHFVGLVDSNDNDDAIGGNYGRSIEFDAKQIAAVTGCASADAARPILQGVEFDGHNMTATDSYKLLTYKFEGLTGRYDAKSLALAAKHFKLSQDRLLAEVMPDNGLKFWFNNVVMVIKDRRDSGDFPNWPQLIPSEVSPVNIIMGDIPKVTNPFGSKSELMVKLFDGGAHIYAFGGNDGRAIVASLPGEWPVTGEDNCSLNFEHFAKAIAGFDGVFTIDCIDPLKPLTFKGRHNGIALLMPIRTDQPTSQLRELLGVISEVAA